MLLKRLYKNIAFWCTFLLFSIVLLGVCSILVISYFSRDLPDYTQLIGYNPASISRIYSYQRQVISELALEKRIYTRIEDIPPLVINAFIAAEDHNYYHHKGIDITSIIRACLQNIANIASDKHLIGGSTITQQVVKNFLLTNERSISRKIKEAILAYRINNIYSKERILELYLNQIYLGNYAYGITSAALSYFDKDLNELTIEEAALLAALPKAPSNLDPRKNIQRATSRRNWVIDRMYEVNFITDLQAKQAKSIPITLAPKQITNELNQYYAESVRLQLVDKFGFDTVYTHGLSIYTHLNDSLQSYATEALHQGLLDFDKKQGYRGPITNINFTAENWAEQLSQIEPPKAIGNWRLGIVLKIHQSFATIGIEKGKVINLLLKNCLWAKQTTNIEHILKKGDIILLSNNNKKEYLLQQIPAVNGAIVVMDPKTGKVLAMEGGYSFAASKYNRAIQALRQPGSVFKPFIYLAALEKGYTVNSLVEDEPIAIPLGPGQVAWTPKNLGNKFSGTITMQEALEKSKNLATVYLASKIGLETIRDVAIRLKVYDKIEPLYYSMALGAIETTLMKLACAYATFANGGKEVKYKLIDMVQDKLGNVIYTSENRECEGCVNNTSPSLSWTSKSLIEPKYNYYLVSMLEGVIERGSGIRAKRLGKTIAGKTGTSNDSNDTWFIGFTPDIVVAVFVGYDVPKSLGKRAQGASVALPIFINFMEKALKDMPSKPFPVFKEALVNDEILESEIENIISTWESEEQATPPTRELLLEHSE